MVSFHVQKFLGPRKLIWDKHFLKFNVAPAVWIRSSVACSLATCCSSVLQKQGHHQLGTVPLLTPLVFDLSVFGRPLVHY